MTAMPDAPGAAGGDVPSDLQPASATTPATAPAGDLQPAGVTMPGTTPATTPATTGDAAFDLDLAVASIRADSADAGMLLAALIDQLRDALGARLQSTYAGGGLLRRSRDRTLTGVTITLGDDVLAATVEGGSVRCTIGHGSGGIRIRSDQVAMDAWLRTLLNALQAEAAHSQVTRTALESMVIGGTTP